MNKEIKRPRFSIPHLSADTRELTLELVTLLIALALTPVRFFFGTYPFGLAFACASKRRTPFAVAGGAIGALLFIDDFVPYLITLIALVAIRLVGSVWLNDNGEKSAILGEGSRPSFMSSLFCERASVRVAICALCTLGINVYRVISGGFAYYDIFVLIFSVVFASILTYALCNAIDEGEPSSKAIGICALLFMVVFAIRGKEILGLDVSMVISYGAILYASRYSSRESVALGALLGLCHGVSFAPVFAIGALASCVLWSFSYYFAIVGALVLSAGYGVLVSGYEALVYLLPELLLASLVMYPLTRFNLLPVPSFLSRGGQARAESAKGVGFKQIRASLRSLGASFKDISSMLCELSARAKAPDREFYKDACLEICEKHCYTCPKRSICWERDTMTTKDNIARLAEEAFVAKSLSFDPVDQKFLHRCPNIEKIVEEINILKKELATSNSRSDKLEVSAQDYELISRLIDELSASVEELSKINEDATSRAHRACVDIGLRFDSIEVSGGNYNILISGVDADTSKCSLVELKTALEDALEISLTEPIMESEGEECSIHARLAPSIEVCHKAHTHSSSQEDENGDTVCTFYGQGEKFYMLLCDGMGTGKDARTTSSLCAEFMKRILSSCQSKELCLTMLNNFIRAKSLECSSSVDLLEIDLASAEASLTKSGAAPSFIKRGENVFRLHSKTAPIGIMKALDAERLDFSLREGDIVVMVSDGIASDERDSKYLVDFLSKLQIVSSDEATKATDNVSEKEVVQPANAPLRRSSLDALSSQGSSSPRRLTLEALPEAIISLAKARGVSKDDMSVCVTLIQDANASILARN